MPLWVTALSLHLRKPPLHLKPLSVANKVKWAMGQSLGNEKGQRSMEVRGSLLGHLNHLAEQEWDLRTDDLFLPELPAQVRKYQHCPQHSTLTCKPASAESGGVLDIASG